MPKPNNYHEFMATIIDIEPSGQWSEALKALWYDAKSDWKASHDIAQEMHTDLGSWIHAYLHRREGDRFNADYWYGRAGRDYPKNTLEEEHQEITEHVLNS